MSGEKSHYQKQIADYVKDYVDSMPIYVAQELLNTTMLRSWRSLLNMSALRYRETFTCAEHGELNRVRLTGFTKPASDVYIMQ